MHPRTLPLLACPLFALPAAAAGDPVPSSGAQETCCISLEERIAELEAAAARKGGRKVSLTLTGQINRMILSWDDGRERDAYSVGNKNDQTSISLSGELNVGRAWSAGYDLTLRLEDNLSDAVDQGTGDAGFAFNLWHANVWIAHKTLGRLTVGQASRATDTVPEADLSAAATLSHAGFQDIGGAFALRRADGVLSVLHWGDLIDHFNGDTANVVRYGSPALAGYTLSAAWGEDGIWDLALQGSQKADGVVAAAAIGYATGVEKGLEGEGAPARISHATTVGSFSLLHEATGLNITAAAGERTFEDKVLDNDGNARTPKSARFLFLKGGWIAKLTGLGPTAFYGEWAWFQDHLSAGMDAEAIASLSPEDSICAGAGSACRVAGSVAEVWGVGAVQHIEVAEMQIYLGYRRYSAEVDLAEGDGRPAGAAAFQPFSVIMAGSKVAF